MGDLPGGTFDSQARGVSGDGGVIVGSASASAVASFRWTEATGMVDIGRPPGGSFSAAFDVSADGSVVVGDSAVAGDRVATIWDEVHGMRDLSLVLVELGLGSELEGWDLEQATAISDDGLTVVGWGYRADGTQEGWVAFLGQPSLVEVPTTSTGALIVFGCILAAVALVALRLR